MFNIYLKEMKKFFSLVALVAVFAACQPEKVSTAFSVAGATANINVQVFNVNTGKPYEGTYNVATSEGAYASGIVSIESPVSTGISKHDVTLTVTGPKLAKSYTYAATIPDVLPGGHAEVNAIIVVGEDGDAYTYELVGTPDVKTETVEMVNSHYPTHSHADLNWYYNNSEFLLEGEVEYDVLSGAEILASNFFLGFDEALEENYGKIYDTGMKVEKAVLPITVSAYAMWHAWATYTIKTGDYKVEATNVLTGQKLTAGTMTISEYSSTDAQYKEMAYPGADGHYEEGHGHDSHGSAANAGGGIIFSE